ncbi:MAG: hypothetical protein Q9223_007601 [Gallowayella weberi]
MEKYQQLRRSSSEDRDEADTEGLLKHEFRPQELGSQERKARRPLRYAWLAFHILLITTYTLVFVVVVKNSASRNAQRSNVVYSPLNEVLIPEKKTVHASFGSKNPFKGPPSDELDHAWHQLFANSNVRVSAEDLRRINRTSVPLGDGSGYYAIPGE